MSMHRSVHVATPTGFLATRYQQEFHDDITADTVHSAFHYPVSPDEPASTNWEIAHFDLVVLDEISMVWRRIFHHVLKTISQLPTRPIVLLSWDDKQQQPIELNANRVIQVESILQDQSFFKSVNVYHLTKQHRCDDDKYNRFLDHIRHWQPSQHLLDTIQQGRVQCKTNEPTDDDIMNALKKFPTATVLTVSRRAANRINAIVVTHAFRDKDPLAIIQCDCEMEPIPLYKEMKVMITQNRNKSEGVVNGQVAAVHSVHNNTVFLTLPSGKLVYTHPVKVTNNIGRNTTVFPFSPAYALTICKAQGQTLANILVWFDVNTLPPGSAYVALSRVKRLEHLHFLTAINTQHFQPVLTP